MQRYRSIYAYVYTYMCKWIYRRAPFADPRVNPRCLNIPISIYANIKMRKWICRCVPFVAPPARSTSSPPPQLASAIYEHAYACLHITISIYLWIYIYIYVYRQKRVSFAGPPAQSRSTPPRVNPIHIYLCTIKRIPFVGPLAQSRSSPPPQLA